MQGSVYASLALVSAACSASATVLIRQGLRGSTPQTGFWINLAVGVGGLWTAVFLLTPADALAFRAVPFFVLSGLIGTVGGRFARFLGIERVGASVAAAINNLNPFIATGLAILLLGERVTLPILLGTSVIVFGTILLSLSGRQVGFRPRHLLYPFTAAFCFGTVAIIRKLGLAHTGPLFGAAVNMTTAFIAYSAFLTVTSSLHVIQCQGRSLWYFVAAGVAENTGVCLLIVALSLGNVSIVAPLAGTAPLFVLPMTHVFLRGIESLTWRIVAGSVLIVCGVVLLTASR
jgi:DME family drug/metabolite transporter